MPDSSVPVFKPKPGVFSDRQLSEILYSLEGKHGLPLKYAYFNVQSWAIRFSDNNEQRLVVKMQNKNAFSDQYDMMTDTLELVLGALENYNKISVVDIGPGTGYPTLPILAFLKEKEQLDKYIAIDITEEMNQLAIKNLTSIPDLANMQTASYVHDFEDGHFANIMVGEEKKEGANLFCFFGATLSGMVDRHRALANIRDSMIGGDLLWLGTTLHTSANTLLEEYSKLEINSEQYIKRHKLFMSGLGNLGVDNPSQYGRMSVEQMAHDEDTLRYYYTVDKPFIIQIPKMGNTDASINLEFNTGDQITIQKLKNYKEHELIAELKEAGFKVKMMNVSDDYRTALVLVSV